MMHSVQRHVSTLALAAWHGMAGVGGGCGCVLALADEPRSLTDDARVIRTTVRPLTMCMCEHTYLGRRTYSRSHTHSNTHSYTHTRRPLGRSASMLHQPAAPLSL